MKTKLGLKGSINRNQIEDRKKYSPDIYEIHLNEEDLFGNNKIKLKETIKELQGDGIKVYLHHPMKINGLFLHTLAEDDIREDYFRLTNRILVEICEEFDIKVVIHMNYGTEEDLIPEEDFDTTKEEYILMVARMLKIDREFGKGRFLWENGIIGTGGYRPDNFLVDLLSGTELKLCLDISHLGIGLHNLNDVEKINNSIEYVLKKLEHNIEYFHVVDSDLFNGHDSLTLGEGLIDFKRIKKYIIEKDYIYEIGLKNLDNCEDMIISHEYFKKL